MKDDDQYFADSARKAIEAAMNEVPFVEEYWTRLDFLPAVIRRFAAAMIERDHKKAAYALEAYCQSEALSILEEHGTTRLPDQAIDRLGRLMYLLPEPAELSDQIKQILRARERRRSSN